MLDFEQIKKALPQRFPYILVDRIVELTPKKKVVGIKNITGNEICFLGHFPDKSIMPATMVVEAMAQVSTFLFYEKKKKTQRLDFYLGVIKDSRFLKPVLPGDQLRIEAEAIRMMKDNATVKVVVLVDENKTAEGELIFVRRK